MGESARCVVPPTGSCAPRADPALPVSQANVCCSPPLPRPLIAPVSRAPRLGRAHPLGLLPALQPGHGPWEHCQPQGPSRDQWFLTPPLLTDDRCQPSLGRRREPGPSLTCSVGAACPHRPSWYDQDGARRSPGQTPGGAGVTELRISPSQLGPGAALRCQVDGYRDECDSDQFQPLGTVTPNVPRVEVSWPAGKAALREGDGFTLRCQGAAPRPPGYVWSHGDVWLPEARQDLRVDKAAGSDGGSYACGVWVSGPGWGYLSLSARESVEVQRSGPCQCLSPGLMAGVVVAILLLVILVNVGACYLLRRGRRQAGAEGAAEGAELSRRPKTESPYEELQGRTQDIYSQLDSPQAGSH
nr:uncharacterized protein LOC112060788 [Chrysemys picta bellii]